MMVASIIAIKSVRMKNTTTNKTHNGRTVMVFKRPINVSLSNNINKYQSPHTEVYGDWIWLMFTHVLLHVGSMKH